VLPHVLPLPALRGLWLALGLLFVVGVVAAGTPVPSYRPGVAVSIPAGSQAGPETADVLILLPARDDQRLRPGQPTHLQLPTGTSHLARLVAVEPQPLAPAAVQQRFGVAAGGALVGAQSLTVAHARWETPAAPQASAPLGAVYPARVEVGTRRLGALVPGLGPLLGE
jgi:hypothetical protein